LKFPINLLLVRSQQAIKRVKRVIQTRNKGGSWIKSCIGDHGRQKNNALTLSATQCGPARNKDRVYGYLILRFTYSPFSKP